MKGKIAKKKRQTVIMMCSDDDRLSATIKGQKYKLQKNAVAMQKKKISLKKINLIFWWNDEHKKDDIYWWKK